MNGKNILIVGGSGFIGRNLVDFYKKKKFKVISLSLFRKNFKADINILVDLFDKDKLQKKLTKININYIIFAAGYVSHKPINQKNDDNLNVHFVGLVNLINSINLSNLKKIIYIGTSEEYKFSKKKLNEKSELNPITSYSLAKYLSVLYLLNLYKNWNLPVTIFRPFLLYGPYQETNRLIPYLIKNMIKKKEVLCTEGNQIRDFLHIDDFLRATFLALKSKLTNGEIFNIASGKPIKVKKIIDLIKKKYPEGKFNVNKTIRSSETLVLCTSIAKAYKFMKWKPNIPINKGISSIIEYYEQN